MKKRIIALGVIATMALGLLLQSCMLSGHYASKSSLNGIMIEDTYKEFKLEYKKGE